MLASPHILFMSSRGSYCILPYNVVAGAGIGSLDVSSCEVGY